METIRSKIVGWYADVGVILKAVRATTSGQQIRLCRVRNPIEEVLDSLVNG